MATKKATTRGKNEESKDDENHDDIGMDDGTAGLC